MIVPNIIQNINAGSIYSVLGNNSSLVPLAIKDIANSCGLTTASYIAGDKVEGKDRFIDEFGTQAIWLWGIPAYKKILDWTLFKSLNFDPNIDARILKNKDILKAAQDFAPTQEVKNALSKVAQHPQKFKYLTVGKFAASTILTSLTYFGLTKFRHKYTENQIKKDYFDKQSQENTQNENKKLNKNLSFEAFKNGGADKKSKDVAFTGGVQDFIFDPVKNLMLVDASITGERLSHARNPQDFMGYVIKEGSFWAFMYFAGPVISKALEKNVEKLYNKSIGLDARVIESPQLKQVLQEETLQAHLETFKNAAKDDLSLYKFAVDSKNKNFVIEMAKKSGIIKLFDKEKNLVDTRSYIDLADLKGVCEKLEKLLTQYKTSGEDLETFMKTLKHLKRRATLTNIGSCIAALGIIAPTIMLISRKIGKNSEYQVKADIEKKLQQERAQA